MLRVHENTLLFVPVQFLLTKTPRDKVENGSRVEDINFAIMLYDSSDRLKAELLQLYLRYIKFLNKFLMATNCILSSEPCEFINLVLLIRSVTSFAESSVGAIVPRSCMVLVNDFIHIF